MRKALISLTCIASVQLSACSSAQRADDDAPRSSLLERIPLVYRQDIQQGNVIDQDMVNQLRPGLSKRQVRFLMGTPMLKDVFHANRWDYVYTMTHGWGERQERKIHLYFDGDRLARVEGDLKPSTVKEGAAEKTETMVSVPDYVDPHRGIIKQAYDSVSGMWKQKTKPAAPPPPPSAPGAGDDGDDAEPPQ
jgi:outer membrane protein assembly factor BamE